MDFGDLLGLKGMLNAEFWVDVFFVFLVFAFFFVRAVTPMSKADIVLFMCHLILHLLRLLNFRWSLVVGSRHRTSPERREV